jgi:hypothetical protein
VPILCARSEITSRYASLTSRPGAGKPSTSGTGEPPIDNARIMRRALGRQRFRVIRLVRNRSSAGDHARRHDRRPLTMPSRYIHRGNAISSAGPTRQTHRAQRRRRAVRRASSHEHHPAANIGHLQRLRRRWLLGALVEAFDLALGLRMVGVAVLLGDAQAGDQVPKPLRPPVKREV